jgi:hypothetical protein
MGSAWSERTTASTGRRSRIFQRNVVILSAVRDAARLSRSRRPSADGLLGDARREQGQDFIRRMIGHVAPLLGVAHRNLGTIDDPSASRRAVVAALIRATGSADHPAGSDRGRRPFGGFRAGDEHASQSNRSQRKRPARGRFDRC